MSELKNLFSSYPLSELIMILVMVLAAGEAVWKLLEWYFNKANILFGEKAKREVWRNQLVESITKLDTKMTQNMDTLDTKLIESIEKIDAKVDELKEQNIETHERQDQQEKTTALIQERMQEEARSYLIDGHHKYCYEFKKIDDLALQSLERRYLYYKTAGGDTFMDHLMEEVRSLPRVNYYLESPTTNS